MNDTDRIRQAAQRIADWHLQDAEFCIVYEDEDCADMTEDEWRQIYDLILHSRATLPVSEGSEQR